jgi:hypothetical protein
LELNGCHPNFQIGGRRPQKNVQLSMLGSAVTEPRRLSSDRAPHPKSAREISGRAGCTMQAIDGDTSEL